MRSGESSNVVACNRYHTVEQRLSRWLLMTRDRVNSDTFNLTHEFIAYMLGTTRSGVTTAALALQDAGLIRYRRGRIMILDEKKLEGVTCDCYRIIREDVERIIAA
jgi:CRP-like cAMP-binding protein